MHFLLHCSQFNLMRTDLCRQPADVPELDITSMDSTDLSKLLLYGNSDLNIVDNRMIIEAIISFIEVKRQIPKG